MTDFEPGRIWAVTGLVVVSICGMTYVQLRSSEASLGEVASLAKSNSIIEHVDVQSSTPAEISVYEAAYVGGNRSTFQPPAGLNPLTPLYFPPSRRTVDSGAQGEEDNSLTNVAQDIVSPEYTASAAIETSVGVQDGFSFGPYYGPVQAPIDITWNVPTDVN